MREFISQNVVSKDTLGEQKRVRPAFSAHYGSKQPMDLGLGQQDNLLVKQQQDEIQRLKEFIQNQQKTISDKNTQNKVTGEVEKKHREETKALQ